MLEANIAARDPIKVSTPRIQIGNSGSLMFTGGPGFDQVKFAYDAGLWVSLGQRGLEISTPVRDRFGRLIANIDHNHWTVSSDKSLCSDKNYTDDSLEIKDGRGLVVLQIRLLADRVQIQGEWRDEFGHGVRLSECQPPAPKGGCITFWNNSQRERELEQIIEPMFEYPSSEHLGRV